jgi:hypothetical protein
MRTLYALSKPIEGKPRLIGELTEENGEYSFRYMLGNTFPEWFLQIDEFPDPVKKYGNDEVRPLIRRLIPEPDSIYLQPALKAANLNEYDEWGLLKCYGQRNMQEDVYLFEEMPEQVITCG